MNRAEISAGLLLIVGAALQVMCVHSEDVYENPPISYSASVPHDDISGLETRYNATAIPGAQDDKAVMRRLLAELGAPVSSQILVFSKTSFQNDLISPAHPRSLFFSDNVYIGWVPGGLAEVASMDPELGCIFYRFDPRQPKIADTETKLHFIRDNDCLRCHGGQFIRDIPGVLARSLATDIYGQPQLQFGSLLVDYTTPISDRWGGWFVTGKHGAAQHRGNSIASGSVGFSPADFIAGANVTNLTGRANLAAYMAPGSDILALMVFEYQIAFHNALTRASFHCRQMLAYQRGLQHDLKEPITEEPVYDSCKRVFAHSTQDLLDALLFKDEAPMPDGGIESLSGFESDFQAHARKDSEGRSLRDFQLLNRLFKYRCSYLIYSPGFTKLQPVLRRMVLERLWRVLTNPSTEPRYAYLADTERSAIRAILQQTVPNLPACYSSK